MNEVAESRINDAFTYSKLDVCLSEQKLKTLPPSISTLTNLQKLDISKNQLQKLIPSISTLTSLRQMDLSSNNLTTLPVSISALTNLRQLELGFNQLLALSPSISTLTNLQWLYLSSNRLTGLHESVSMLTNLKWLFLSSNQLAVLPASISTLTNLQRLCLGSNQLKALPESISALTKLQQLDLCNNQLTMLPSPVSTLTGLVSLHLSSNQLTSIPPFIADFTNLKVLDVNSNRFTGIPFYSFLPSSTILNIDNNPIEFVPSDILKQGTKAILKYHDTIFSALQLPQKKVVIVGEGKVGKTSFVRRLKKSWSSLLPLKRTEGVDIHSIEISKDKYISVWDFAGQEHFLSSHKLYFTKNSVFAVVVQLSDSTKIIRDQLSKWLFIIHQLCPGTQVIIIATKMDLVHKNQVHERAIQLDHFLTAMQQEFGINLVLNTRSEGSISNHFSISSKKSINISIVRNLLQDLCKEVAIQTFKGSVHLLNSIKSCEETCITVKKLSLMSNLPLQHCIQTLKHLEELSMIVYIESNEDDEDATVILNGDVISKAFNQLKLKGRELTQSEPTGWIDYNLAKSTVSPKIKFKMFIDVIEKAKLVYVDRQSDDETQWKIFIPHIALEKLQTANIMQNEYFSAGRLFFFKHQLPIGFFEHIAIQMQFLVKLASYSIMMSSYGIKIVGNASAVFIEKIKINGEFINAIRITTTSQTTTTNNPQLFHEVIEAFEECLFAYFQNGHDVHKFVKRLVLCSCQHCQANFKSNQFAKQQYLPLSQDDSIQEGIASILTQYVNGQKTSGCMASNAGIPLTDLLFELQLLNDLPFIDYNTINILKHEVRGKGGFGTVRVGVLSNGQRVAVKEINDVQAAFKEIRMLRQINHKHIVKVLGYSRHESSARMFIITELLDKSLSQLIAEMNGSLASDLCMLVRIALNVVEALSHLHSQRLPIIHRDIKPENVMFDESKNVKIIDFGIAKQAALPYLYERRGTPGYCAPEVIGQMKYNAAADIYRDMSQTNPLLAPVVTLLQALIDKCCDKDPSKRQTALECAEQLKTILEVAKRLSEKYRDQIKSEQLSNSNEFIDDLSFNVSPQGSPINQIVLQEASARDIPEADLTLIHKLGEGGFGEVWLAQWRGIKVAVKQLKSIFMAESLKNELKTLVLSHYKYIVTLNGISTDSKTGNLMLVMEYMKHGSLDDLLFNQKVKMSPTDVIQIALDVAKGINFLHMQTPIIIHRDLKSANILLHSDKKRAKIADFGTAKDLLSSIQPKTVIGSLGIAMPPEMMDELTYDEKIDIFGFGVVLYEMLTNARLPMMEDHNQRFARIRANVSNKDLAELIVTCCAVDPKQRPSINTVINELKVFKKKMPQ